MPLPYAYDALEPVIDARTVELHYNFHHKPAVAVANKAEEGLAQARETGDFALVKHFEKELALGLSSHILHTLYWGNLSAKGGHPTGDLLKAIEKNPRAEKRVLLQEFVERFDRTFLPVAVVDVP